jgi:pyruvate dehydrogenase E2 component (dihydrolipoamide acetyltransferase)
VNEKGLWDISNEVSDLVEKAQSRKLRPQELAGGSVTISNLGRLGGTAFTPIVNPPQVAILGLSRNEFRPYWDGSTWQAIPTIPLDLSYDHRIINGADAARFMSAYRKFISMPELMFS